MHATVFQRLCLQEALPTCLWGVAPCGRAEGFWDEVTLLGDRALETSSQGSVRSLAFAQGDFKDVGGSCRKKSALSGGGGDRALEPFRGEHRGLRCFLPLPLGQGAWWCEPASRGLRS